MNHCAQCGGRLEGRRFDARFCGARCRVQFSRAIRRKAVESPNNGVEETQGAVREWNAQVFAREGRTPPPPGIWASELWKASGT